MRTSTNAGPGSPAHSGADELLEIYRRSVADRVSNNGEGAPGIPQDILDWLAELALLYGIPFEYLVPDAAMLPAESIRFFYLDENWVARLVDGAVNIALGSSQDYVHVLTTFEELAWQTALQRGRVRPRLRGKPPQASLQAGAAVTGVLLRSAVVGGWPGMEACAYADEGKTQPLPLLRLDRLSDSVLIALFNGVPQLVEFSEPPEGLHFGVVGVPSAPGKYQVALRSVGGAVPAGEQLKDAQGNAYTAPISFRDDRREAGVLDLQRSSAAIAKALDALGAGPAGAFTSSQFAVEMVKGAGVQQFKVGTANTCNGNLVKT